jgi:hypothetical protein
MTRRTGRWISIIVLAMLAFSQANTVLAACAMDRGDMRQMMATQADHDCGDEPIPTDDDATSMSFNACLVQSTADLQAPGGSALVAISNGSATVIFVPRNHAPGLVPRHAELRGIGIPSRILLHSFLV